MSDERKEPYCEDAGNGEGLGCPECRRFEVRAHPVSCKVHGEHTDLVCCWCGTLYFSFTEIDHTGPGHQASHTSRTIQ